MEEPPPDWTGAQYQTVPGRQPEEGSIKQVESRSFLIIWVILLWLLLTLHKGGT